MNRPSSRLFSTALSFLLTSSGLLYGWRVVGQNQTMTAPSNRLNYPTARRVDQVDTYHGVEVADPYRWLEDHDSYETRDWVKAQDQVLKAFVNQAPGRAAIQKRLAELGRYDMYASPRFVSQEIEKRGSKYFFIKTNAGASQATLYVQNGIGGQERVLLDLRSRHGNDAVRLAGFSTSSNGRLVAYQTSNNLSNWLSLNIVDVSTGEDFADTLTGLHFAGGPVDWTSDSRGFFYTQFDKPAGGDERRAVIQNPKVFYHLLGTKQEEDRLVYAQPEKPSTLYNYQVTDDGHYIVIRATEGASNKSAILYKDLRARDVAMKSLIAVADANYVFLGNSGSRFWFYTDLEAPRGRVIAVDINKADRSNWTEVIAQTQESISGGSNVGGNALGIFGNRFVVVYLQDARPVLRIFGLDGKLLKEVALPEGGSIWGGFYGNQRDPEVFYRFLELTSPGTVYRLDAGTGQAHVFRRATVNVKAQDFVVRQIFFRGKDGTRVPMFIAHKRGLQLDGNNPTYLYGYGAFGWVSFTWFQPHMIAWMEQGGVFAVAAIRGGGEYGDEWHKAGIKLNKQNTIDDYLSGASWLIENRYTSRSRLVANGSSASGAVAAAAVLQRPELFGASVIHIPILDMLRFDKFTAASYWKPEFGSPSNPEEFKALYAYSPYHNLQRGRCYPPTLVMAGERDQTAVPLHAYKFVAAMQSVQACNQPVLVKTMWGTGHSFGSTPERSVDSWVDLLSFLFQTLDMKVGRLTSSKASTVERFD